MNQIMRNVRLIFIFFLTLASVESLALDSDHSAIAQLAADKADLNQQTHRGVYTGNVQFDQGTTHLSAIKAITKSNQQNKLIYAQALGKADKLAHFWTQTEPNKPPLHAYALEIEYYPEKHLVILTGNARVEQGDDSLSAPKITYDIIKKHVVSIGDKTIRTTILFHPGKKT